MNTKDHVRTVVDSHRDALIDLSHRIHANPEVGFEEEKASAWIAELLEQASFEVRKSVADLPTAFSARAGNGSLHIAVCAEYDALPGIGHACGHNVIAAASTGAAIAMAVVADELDLTVTLLGTPAEENGGGKVIMIEAGLFDGVHAAMMVHPNEFDDVAVRASLAITNFHVRYTGRAVHASSYPDKGVNAADALIVAQVAIGLMRQQMQLADRVHGITTSAGDAPNIIPETATATYYVRAGSMTRLAELEEKVRNCLDAGALATGCDIEISPGSPICACLDPDRDIADLYRANAEALGRTFGSDRLDPRIGASTDMGNVTQLLPAIHPTIRIDAGGAVNHQRAFADAAVSESADRAIVDAAVAMAWTVADLAVDETQRARLLNGERRPSLHTT